jgi:AraC family transcriptional regulator
MRVAMHLRVSHLYRGGSVAISDVCCRAHGSGYGREEWSETNQIVFVRAGVFIKRQGRREIIADPNQVLFFNRHEGYQVSHPGTGGDDCTVFIFATGILLEAIQILQKTVTEEEPFRCGHALNGQRTFLLHQQVRRSLLTDSNDRLMVEEACMTLLASVLADTCSPRAIQRPARSATRKAHHEHAEATRLLLAKRFTENLSLNDIATLVHASPFHLARIFHRETGLGIHQYRNRLRVRAGLEHIQQGASDLTELALDLGYSSHSHFTDAFRRAFGVAPSTCRGVSSAHARQLSKNLEAAQDGPD